MCPNLLSSERRKGVSWVTVFTFLAIAVASLFARFRLGFSEWVFPGLSHTTIPKVQAGWIIIGIFQMIFVFFVNSVIELN